MLRSIEETLSSVLKDGNPTKIKKVFEMIYVDYAKLVSFCVGKYVSNEEVIKDLTNDVFLSFFNHATSVKGNIKAYLCTSARNKAFDYLKKEKAYMYVDDEEKFIETSATYYSSVMLELKEILTEQELRIVELHVVDGYSFIEIGEQVHISSNNANVIYFRALKKYRNAQKGDKYEKR